MSGNQLRFYLDPQSQKDNFFYSENPAFCHQLKNVLRLQEGQEILIFTGDNKEYLCQIDELTNKKFVARIVSAIEKEAPSCQIHLFQALPSKDSKLELIVAKATELGVSSITPIITEHSQKTGIKKTDRLQKIIIEAAEQSGRSNLPILYPVQATLELPAPSQGIVLDQSGRDPLHKVLEKINPSEINLFIGPEGGFSEAELEFFKKEKYCIASLNKNILRTETAAIASLAISGIFLCQN